MEPYLNYICWIKGLMALSRLNVHNDFIELKHSFTPLSVVSIITMQKKRFKTIYKVMWKYKISQNTCVFWNYSWTLSQIFWELLTWRIWEQLVKGPRLTFCGPHTNHHPLLLCTPYPARLPMRPCISCVACLFLIQ